METLSLQYVTRLAQSIFRLFENRSTRSTVAHEGGFADLVDVAVLTLPASMRGSQPVRATLTARRNAGAPLKIAEIALLTHTLSTVTSTEGVREALLTALPEIPSLDDGFDAARAAEVLARYVVMSALAVREGNRTAASAAMVALRIADQSTVPVSARAVAVFAATVNGLGSIVRLDDTETAASLLAATEILRAARPYDWSVSPRTLPPALAVALVDGDAPRTARALVGLARLAAAYGSDEDRLMCALASKSLSADISAGALRLNAYAADVDAVAVQVCG